MCPLITYKIELITREDHSRRGVAILISEDRKATAKSVFDKLCCKPNDIERTLRTRFDAWIDGQNNKKWYHGWTQSEFQGRYTKCFVFKYYKNRFYGFLCNPKKSNTRYQVCVLISHALKKEWETDEADLRDVEAMRTTSAVKEAIDVFFGGDER